MKRISSARFLECENDGTPFCDMAHRGAKFLRDADTLTNRRSAQADLVVVAYNARYTHASLGVRWLVANLGDNPPRCAWHEFDLRVPVEEAAIRIVVHDPKLLALGVYIWNAQKVLRLIECLKAMRPDVRIILGGPEVAVAALEHPVCRLADLILTGEAEAIFGDWCRRLLAGETPPSKIIHAPLPDLAELTLPYSLYDATDLQTRHIYVETTRGCPFQCDFCVSGCEAGVREFPLDTVLTEVMALAERGVRTLRFVDRTFNARPERAARILNTLRPWADQGLRLHLEFTPQSRYRSDLAEALCAWPPGSLHIELGIQSLNETVSRRVRRPGIGQTEAALNFLLRCVRADVHADLIVGLPGEDWDSVAASFDGVYRCGSQELQVGILKNLPGTQLERHVKSFEMVFDPAPPYALLSSATLTPDQVQRLKHFAAFWDRLANHNGFPHTLPFILRGHTSPFHAFMHLSDWLYAGFKRTHHLSLDELIAALYAYLTLELKWPDDEIRQALTSDFLAEGRRPERALPKCLRRRAQ